MPEYSTRWVTIVTAAVAALAAVAVSRHPLVLAAALLLAAEAARGALLRPTLRITDEGLDVVVALRRIHVPWAAVEAVRTDRQRRRLVGSTWLEVDTGEQLLAVPAYRLDAPVAEVVEAISRRM